ncbi:UDP-glycosyltransferase 91A1-like [Actinidia eriantha]|uniref:UDP-glycosyltransferase 91A1-like n=1 Tax=Actinidia eriantha TaxID=165200 RepID=UPI00258280DC|nr:UDP-glycosyltransferase 91A1-like [Actinidia eriantha]
MESSISNPPISNDKKLHIFMFPWLAFGHMIPFLELSKLIALRGHKVTFLSTPKNIDRLPKLPPHLSPLIALTKIPLPRVDKLPRDAEATIDLPYDQVKYLKKAYDEPQQPTNNPSLNCYKTNVPTGYLCDDDRTKPEDFTVPPKWIPFETSIAFRIFEIKPSIDDLVRVDDENIPVNYRFGESIDGCDVIAVRSSYEFEPEWLKLLEEIHQKPVIPVGQLPAAAVHGSGGEEWRGVKEWLDGKPKGSVVYVAFGSESRPSQLEVTELAHGLERSELPFFWVLRKVAGCEAIELPDGFEERTKGIGVVCTSWAPQLGILSHDSVGGFLTRSGWSSLVEGVQYGKALILLTFLADTGLIARLLEEKKMGYLIPRGELDGSFTCDSVAESLRLVMVEEGGKIYRDRVKEMSGLFGDRDMQDKYVDNFLDYLMTHRNSGLKKL